MRHFSWTENFFLSPDWLDGTNHSISLDVAFCADMVIEVIREIEIMCQSQFETNELRLNACSVFRETVIICLKMAEYGKKNTIQYKTVRFHTSLLGKIVDIYYVFGWFIFFLFILTKMVHLSLTNILHLGRTTDERLVSKTSCLLLNRHIEFCIILQKYFVVTT